MLKEFKIEGNIIIETQSEMQLQAIRDEEANDDMIWISGWFNIKNEGLIMQKFVILDGGSPTYQLAAKAVDYWGFQIWGIIADANEMSPSFGSKLIIPALK